MTDRQTDAHHRGVAGESGISRIGSPKTQTETYSVGVDTGCPPANVVYPLLVIHDAAGRVQSVPDDD